MKKLLLILLCLPFIGFGQDDVLVKYNSEVEEYQNKIKIIDVKVDSLDNLMSHLDKRIDSLDYGGLKKYRCSNAVSKYKREKISYVDIVGEKIIKKAKSRKEKGKINKRSNLKYKLILDSLSSFDYLIKLYDDSTVYYDELTKDELDKKSNINDKINEIKRKYTSLNNQINNLKEKYKKNIIFWKNNNIRYIKSDDVIDRDGNVDVRYRPIVKNAFFKNGNLQYKSDGKTDTAWYKNGNIRFVRSNTKRICKGWFEDGIKQYEYQCNVNPKLYVPYIREYKIPSYLLYNAEPKVLHYGNKNSPLSIKQEFWESQLDNIHKSPFYIYLLKEKVRVQSWRYEEDCCKDIARNYKEDLQKKREVLRVKQKFQEQYNYVNSIMPSYDENGNTNYDVEKTGYYKEWNEYGKLIKQLNYGEINYYKTSADNRVGNYKEFYSNGNIKVSGNYSKEHQKTGEWRIYYANGKLKEKQYWKQPYTQKYWIKEKMIESYEEGHHAHSYKDGIWKYYYDGKLIEKKTFNAINERTERWERNQIVDAAWADHLEEGIRKQEEFRNRHKKYFGVKDSKHKTILPIIQEGNMKTIIISFGTKRYKFLIDSGASDMVINSEIKEHLMREGLLNRRDFGEKRVYEIANGSKLEFETATLSSMKIDGKTFNNIKMAIGNKNTSLLLGMSFLNKYKWYFDNNSLVLENK